MNDNNDQVNIPSENSVSATPPKQFWGMNLNTYCMLMHLSLLLSGSGLGIAVLIVLWVVNKDQSQAVDQHGKNMMNFLIIPKPVEKSTTMFCGSPFSRRVNGRAFGKFQWIGV